MYTDLELDAVLRDNQKAIDRRKLAISRNVAEDDPVMWQAVAVAVSLCSAPPAEPKPAVILTKDELQLTVTRSKGGRGFFRRRHAR